MNTKQREWVPTEKWVLRLLALSDYVSKWSKDPSTQCGAVVALSKRDLYFGYNGFPENLEDKREWLEDRSIKYPNIIHAEDNAIRNMGCPATGGSIFVNNTPCESCTDLLIEKGIKRIYFIDREDTNFNKRWGCEDSKQKALEKNVLWQPVSYKLLDK